MVSVPERCVDGRSSETDELNFQKIENTLEKGGGSDRQQQAMLLVPDHSPKCTPPSSDKS